MTHPALWDGLKNIQQHWREIGRRASEAKCPLPAEEGWVMEKKKEKEK